MLAEALESGEVCNFKGRVKLERVRDLCVLNINLGDRINRHQLLEQNELRARIAKTTT